jgi:hypothetical protein
MTKLKTDFPPASDSGIEAACNQYPEIRKWKDALDTAESKWELALAQGEHLKKGERHVNFWNSLIDFHFSFIDTMNELCPNTIDRAAFSEKILVTWDRYQPRRSMSLGQERALTVALVYESGFLPSLIGSKDTPMEAALQVASIMEGLSLETGPEAIRKSIQRFRDSLGEKEVFRLNRETLKLEVFQAKSVLLKGLPNQRGRPRSRKFG